jgi:hypothetical protein
MAVPVCCQDGLKSYGLAIFSMVVEGTCVPRIWRNASSTLFVAARILCAQIKFGGKLVYRELRAVSTNPEGEAAPERPGR